MDPLLLDPVEVRVLGAMIEKEMATPEYYPMSLNALTLACNQKSNRDPVLNLEEPEVVRALDRLRRLGLAMQAAGEGSRVPKFRHALAEKLGLEPEELAVLAELLLRGPQTVGELRNRAERMRPFPDLSAVEMVLQELMDRESPLAIRLPRQPGRKEHRYAHLLAGAPPEEESSEAGAGEYVRMPAAERIAAVEGELAALRIEMEEIRREWTAFRKQFE